MGEAMALRRAMHTARHIAVIGGGLTGCELACSAVAMARKATLINSQRYLMPRAIGEPVGQLVTAAHRAAGIDVRVGVRVSHIDRWRRGWRVVLDDDTVVDSDLVVLTAGETPDVEWLAGTNLDISDGVLCDETLRAVGEDGIVAVGALARWPNLRYSHQPTMVGQWIAALEHGQAAARTLMTGYDAPPVTVVPRFWSDQFGLRIQVCGQLDGPGEVGLTELRPGRRDTARAGVLASYTQAGALTGVVAVNAPRAFNVAARMLLSEPMPSYLGAAVPEPVGVPEPVSVPEPVREEMAMVARQPERRLRAV
jgi:NADPH-dependent 2,4-dienoyl-CoA reductase/sulfur reductase-like enzyme